jgi:hypothetical protein
MRYEYGQLRFAEKLISWLMAILFFIGVCACLLTFVWIWCAVGYAMGYLSFIWAFGWYGVLLIPFVFLEKLPCVQSILHLLSEKMFPY